MVRTLLLQLLACLCISLISFTSFSQENLAKEGMNVSKRNYTSFSERPVANLEAWNAANSEEYYSHPEFGRLPKDAPCQSCVEDLSKRTMDERYFVDITDPSKFYQQKALGELHGEKNGFWVTIDHTLKPVSEGVYESGYTTEQSGFNVLEHDVYIKTVLGKVSFNNWQAFTLTNGELTSIGEMSWSSYSVGEEGVYITDAFPGIDAEMIVFRGAIKTNFIIKSNQYGVFDQLVFRDQFQGNTTLSTSFESGGGNTGTGKFNVFSGDESMLEVGEAVLFAKDGPKELLRVGEYVLNANSFDIHVPFSWINENIGSYQLVVDPLVTGTATLAQASITGSMYNASCNFTNSCNYTLPVARPANATITDVAWTFTYSATGACWLEDGAIRIATGGCLSPSLAGYYWFCNAIGGGTCSGNNQTIFSDVSSCIPAPGCTPTNVNFTLQFFRACYGTTGCSNACIGAGSPWTMTITGQTIAYTNVATPITLSATTVCAGGSITASTTGQYGVPGYTYNWSFSPSGTPSVGTGASTSITFPTSGSVTLYSIVTDACGNQTTSSRVITVTPGPTVNVNSPTICAGQSATLTATGATSYTWTPVATLSSGTGASVTATPATTTTYTVTGTTSGCTGTATSIVTVTSNPVINVNSATICAGQSATLNATGATSYTWTPAATLSSGTGATVTATPAATTTYTITGTTGTCTGTTTSTVTVNPNPVVNVNSATICAGQSATLTATGATSYTWTPAATLSSGTGASVTATPAATTTYTVTGTTGTCTGTATSTVTVTPGPVVNVNSATICAGASATLTATGATSYTWTPTTNLSSGTGASVTANPPTTTTYVVTGTTAGCTGTANSVVTVNPNPVVNVNSATICAGQSATLNATGATSYTWTPSATLSSGTGATVTATPATTTTYTITGTTGTCTGTTTSTVTVSPNPVINVNSATICSGQSATLTATGATSYTWTPSATLSSGTGASVTANPTTTTTYTVTGTTGSCTGTATSTVTVNPNPTVTVLSPTICVGGSATLNAGGGATSYTWTPAATLSSGTGSSVVATPSTTTTYTVTGTTNGCSGTATSTVTVNPIPVISVNDATICAGESATIISTGAANYTWTPSATLSSSVGSPVIATPAVTTTYTVTGTLAGCTSTETATVTVNPNPVVNVNSATICAGQSATLNATGATSYTWTPSATLSSGTGSTVTATPAVTTTYTITGTTGTCSGTGTSTVTVNPIPTVTASNNGPLCSGTTLQLTGTGQAGANYSWTGPNSFTSNTQNPQIPSVGTVNEGTYTVTISLNGCSSTSTTTFALLPGVSSAINTSGPYCSNGNVVTLSSVNPGGTWSGAGITNASTGTFDPSLASVGNNTITYTINGACGGPSTATIVVNSIPSPTFTLSATTGCIPLPVQFTNTTASTNAVSWDFGNGNSGNTSTVNEVYSSSGCFDVTLTVTDNNGCIGTNTLNDVVCVVADPIAQFHPNSAEQSVTDPVFQFINTSLNAVNYVWNFGDNSTSSATNPSHTYQNGQGSYLVELIAYNSAGCSDTARVSVTVKEEQVFYIPNSFTPDGNEHNNTFSPVFTSGVDENNFSLTIYNRWGEAMFETKNPKVGWDGTYHGQLAPAGTYVWSLRFKDPQNDKKYEFSGNVNLFK